MAWNGLHRINVTLKRLLVDWVIGAQPDCQIWASKCRLENNRKCSNVFRGYKERPVAWNGLRRINVTLKRLLVDWVIGAQPDWIDCTVHWSPWYDEDTRLGFTFMKPDKENGFSLRKKDWGEGSWWKFSISLKQLASLPSDETNKNLLVAKHSTFFPWTVQHFLAKKKRNNTKSTLFSELSSGYFLIFKGNLCRNTEFAINSLFYFVQPHLNNIWYTLNRVAHL